jgi:hypothetical protein
MEIFIQLPKCIRQNSKVSSSISFKTKDDWPITRLIFQFVDDLIYDSFMVKPYYYWHVEPDIKRGESPKDFNNLQ